MAFILKEAKLYFSREGRSGLDHHVAMGARIQGTFALYTSEKVNMFLAKSLVVVHVRPFITKHVDFWQRTQSSNNMTTAAGAHHFSRRFVCVLSRRKSWRLASSGATWRFFRCSQKSPAGQYKMHFYAGVARIWASWCHTQHIRWCVRRRREFCWITRVWGFINADVSRWQPADFSRAHNNNNNTTTMTTSMEDEFAPAHTYVGETPLLDPKVEQEACQEILAALTEDEKLHLADEHMPLRHLRAEKVRQKNHILLSRITPLITL